MDLRRKLEIATVIVGLVVLVGFFTLVVYELVSGIG